jgi:formylglycine-generating enzyme
MMRHSRPNYKFFFIYMMFMLPTLIISNQALAKRGLTVEQKTGAQTPFIKGAYYGVVIGNDDYSRANDWRNLKTAVKGARTIIDILKNQYGFISIEVVINGTRKEILDALKDVVSKVKKNDSVLIYYAGHGFWDQQLELGYWIPVDADGDTTYVSNSDIKDRVTAIAKKTKHTLLISDSCFSGALLKRGEQTAFQNDQYYQKAANRKSVQVLAAGRKYVDDNYRNSGHSPFTYYFLEELKSNKEKYFSTTDLSSSVAKSVANNVKQTPEYGILFGAGHAQGEFFFVKPGSEKKKPRVQLTVKTNPLESDIFVNNKYKGTSPLELTMIPGTYTIQAQKKGYLAKKGNVRVKVGADQFYSLTLDKKNSTKVPKEDTEEIVWKYVEHSKNIDDFERFLRQFPQGTYAATARNKIDQLKQKQPKLPSRVQLSIRTNPSDSSIFVNDKYQGFSPLALKLFPGSYTIQAQKKGFIAKKGTVRVKAGADQLYSLNLSISHHNMVLIPTGKFQMGSNNGDDDEKPIHSVYLDKFMIDKFEVTVDEYRKCVKSRKCQEFTTNYWEKKDHGPYKCNWSVPGRDKHPINCVDWHNAKNYCKYVNKRLPTEAEWEKAATWKNGKKYEYPNGKIIIYCRDAILDDGNKYGGNDTDGCGKDRTWKIGSKSKEINGTYDMSGNVWEWVFDWYRKNYYHNSQNRNPTGPSSGAYRVYRGGSWSHDATSLRGSNRNSSDPSFRNGYLGFRCVASP